MSFISLMRTLLFICTVFLASTTFAADQKPVSICADPDPPPWTYWVRDSQGKKTRVFTGFSVDTLKMVFARIGMTTEFHGEYPWARCLAKVQAGEIDFAMDAYHDAERARLFTYSNHYHTLTPQIYYRTNNPIIVRGLPDLKKYKGCGMVGASYAHYQLDPQELDLGTGYDSMIKKLKAERCDYFAEELEVISGYQKLGVDYLADPALQHGPMPGANAPAKHLIAAKHGKAAKWMPEINAAIVKVVKSGDAAANWRTHAGDLPYLP